MKEAEKAALSFEKVLEVIRLSLGPIYLLYVDII